MDPAALVRALADPAVFGGRAAVEVVQTHLSIVCLVGERVYKLKKAVRLPFVDFSTLARRRTACRDEVRLNRRLAPDVYLGTAPLRATAAGLRLGALGDDDGGDVVEVAVVMRRLPQARMLDEVLARGEVDPAAVRELARVVAAFHAAAVRGPAVLAHGDPHRLAAFARANFAELAAAAPGLGAPLVDAVAAASDRAMAHLLPALVRRAAHGAVVDGHGDLHARNICLVAPPVVYDCIEFEPAFRCGDVATEVAFLVMDLRYRGAAGLARAFAAEYAAASGDRELPAILPPLCAYRAMVRAKVAALAAAEPELGTGDRAGAHESALRHVDHAALWLAEAGRPRWLVVCGPPAGGKSTLAAALAALGGNPWLATDAVRKELAGLPPEARGGAGLYTPQADDATYRALGVRAVAATAAGERLVVLDGNFATRARRAAIAAAAGAAGVDLVFAHVHVPRELALARAARRSAGPSLSDAGADVAARRFDAFEPLDELSKHDVVAIDGSRPTPASMRDLLAAMLRRDTAAPA